MNNPRLEPKLDTIPDPPKKFGDDGGHFYRYYDALAEELDEDMVKSLKAQLDGILIFAGLFAGVNSAFLALTLTELSADPAEDTTALLLQFVTGNGTIRSAGDLPSATFAPSPGIFLVNVLFSLSLTLALLSSFIAVLGQQWLVYYRKRSGGGAEHQRWEQLRRYLGAKRWRLETILDDILPGLLQLALVIFCIGFVAYLRTLSKTMYYVIMGPMTIAVGVLLLMGVVGAWDPWCPFKSPLSHLLQGLGNLMKRSSIAAIRLASNTKRFLTHRSRNRSRWSLPSWKEVWGPVVRVVNQALDQALDRSGENVAELEAVAAKRVLCTSEDFNALLYTAVNLHGMTSKESIESFLGDETVYKRLEELWEGGRHSAGSSELLAGEFSRAFLRLIFIGESVELLVEPRYRQRYSEALLPRGQDPISLHPLKQNVDFLDGCIDMGLKSLHTHCNDSIWLLQYCQILKVTVDETYLGSGLFERWLNYIIAEYSILGDCKPHVICLVAMGVHMLNVGFVTPRKPLVQRVLNHKWEPGRELEELEELELALLKRKRLELEQVWEKQQQEEREKREEREEREERQWWPRKLTQAHVLALVLGPVLAGVAMVIWVVEIAVGAGWGAMVVGTALAGLAGLASLLGLLLELRWDWWPRKWMRALVLVLVLVLVLMELTAVAVQSVLVGTLLLWQPLLVLLIWEALLLGLLGLLRREWWPRKRMRTRVLALVMALVLELFPVLTLTGPAVPAVLGLAVLASLLGLLLELRLRWQQQRHRTGRGQPGRGRQGELYQLRGEINQLRGKINPEDFIQVQQQRVKVVQEFVRSVGWEKPLFPEGGLDRPQDTVFGLIKEAFGPYPSQSPRRRDNIHVWLLEQALVISTMAGNFDGLKFIATTSVELLCSLHEGEDADAGRDSWHNQDDCLRSTKILSQCLQVLGEHSNSQGAGQTIRNVGQQLEQYLPQVTTDLEFPRCSTSTLSTWLEIRETLEKLVGGWPGGSNPRLKAAFDAIESATLNIKVAPKTDGNPADPPPIPAADEQAGPSGSPGTAVTERFGENAGEPQPAHRMQEDAGGCPGDQNASVVCSVDSPIKEVGGGDQRKQLEDTGPRLVAQDNSLRTGTSDVQIEFNDCFPLRDQMLL